MRLHARTRLAAGGVAALGVALIALSLGHESSAAIRARVLGVALVFAAAFVFDGRGARALARDTVTAFTPRSAGVPHLVALAGITAIGTVARLRFLALDARYDEAYTFSNYVAKPLSVGMTDYSLPNNHLLNTLLTHDAWQFVGGSMPVIRIPALVAGALLIPAMYAAGRALYSPSAGLVAAGLTAGSGPLIEYSVNARGYSMTWLALVLMIVLAARVATRPDIATWAALAAVATAGVYAIPLMALPAATVAAWLGLLVLRTRTAQLAALAATTTAVTVLSFALYDDTRGDLGWIWSPPAPPLGDFLRESFELAHVGPPLAAGIVLAAAAALGIVLHRSVGRQKLPLPLVAIALVPLFALLLPHPPPYTRSWLYLVPIELLAAGAGVVALGRFRPTPALSRLHRGIVPAMAVLLALITAVAVSERDIGRLDPPVRGAGDLASYLAANEKASAVVVTDATVHSLRFHMGRTGATQATVTAAPPPPPDGPPSRLVVGRAQGETLAEALELIGWKGPPPRLVRRFGDTELYALAG